ncbi:FKBP-type peptidyl-prolyl cis-trans isomerase [Wielerella bovis]|uniref:FKBP-type peptidyl-prolyl cis-trans isomerase n=1 Tax=Wielerella bovis TaxID=2917790 RepID=UPI002018C722|nr:FKBP-type peptidyl-prolyl cis-trans isomerase [Wielerella bovis]ULJ60502.1 FKBP-type peptidyl-prolyl cis-trans isomerase [Wielerella bovis]ULJ62709.1 FKBP-type peptidyl-prolyl cis-trans isomerase [Wielerella bovis]ULJ64935.1 FKBP-type peptidyl-prolyl cis-trans isomerase [Wielerella bovis]ULJ67209.1 FKBP-type peptidyl-prolyl cis-trans isomerase [Wielerella bovis]
MKNTLLWFTTSAWLILSGTAYAQSHTDATLPPVSLPITRIAAEHIPLQYTSSGLTYKVLKSGTGQRPRAHNEVEVRFVSYDTTGQVNDGTLNNVPVILPISAMFEGLREGLMLMPAGSVYELYIPAHLGYREEGQARSKAITYRIELLNILP